MPPPLVHWEAAVVAVKTERWLVKEALLDVEVKEKRSQGAC